MDLFKFNIKIFTDRKSDIIKGFYLKLMSWPLSTIWMRLPKFFSCLRVIPSNRLQKIREIKIYMELYYRIRTNVFSAEIWFIKIWTRIVKYELRVTETCFAKHKTVANVVPCFVTYVVQTLLQIYSTHQPYSWFHF